MSDEARRAVVATLIGLAGSPNYRDRADAGRSLAIFAEVPEAGKALLNLVLDAGDTFVTRETATALLRRQDAVGRVSTREQNLARQQAALSAVGCAKCFFDKAPGKNTDRPELTRMFDYVRPGDVLTGSAVPWKT
ncbi:Resolvase, N terminal domain [Actinoplanes regularis]|uniref:Resolvase, N terminal domain n=1 Tax=Actinoplanes regularis TaxID=52697 RepID=A0A239K9H6_9ACTN|nr:hypothetical protein Are01nite_89480 [Actinoplanes regularis]SNT15047.1 Resolvase, N terminal domain [Actinoplanes regularis]